MKLTTKLTLLIAVLTLSACGTNSVQTQVLANGDVKELATQSNLESEASTLRIYRDGQVIAQEAIFDDSVGGDIARTAVPTAIGQTISHQTAVQVATIKSQTAGSPAVINNVQGAQAVANSNAEQTATAGASQVGPCGLPVCPELGSLK